MAHSTGAGAPPSDRKPTDKDTSAQDAATIIAPTTATFTRTVAGGPDQQATRVADPFGTSLPAGSRAIPDADAPYGASRLVGRYQVVERVGQGAMATVYKAYDPGIHRTLALKFLHPALCADAEYRERFVREARAAGALSHPNIVTVFDVGELEGRPYIAMEFLEGAPLNEVTSAGRTLSVREVIAIGAQLAHALDYAHGKGVIHRDIKPGNIVLIDGASTAIKVADFGIAHLETTESADQTRAGTILGTPHYMSPEQALGMRVDARSDLFSAGVVLYQLVTGKTPFHAENLVTLAHRIAKEEPPPIQSMRSDVPPALRRIIERCLRKAPEKRFANGSEMAEALERLGRELDEQNQQAGKARIVPLRVKWTLIMAAVVAVTMALTSAIVINRQYAAMRDGVLDYGSSLARFMATEHAEATLTEDWVAMEVIVAELMKTQEFHGIAFVDREGIVRASSDAPAVGKLQPPASGPPFSVRNGNVAVRSEMVGGETVFHFEAPITFQGKDIGRVHLGLSEAPLFRVARLSLILMIILVVVTVLAVVVTTWLIADRYSKPLRLLAESMSEIGKGRFDYRIAEKRDDEFGELYRAFDDMAQSLQSRGEPAPPTADGGTTVLKSASGGKRSG